MHLGQADRARPFNQDLLLLRPHAVILNGDELRQDTTKCQIGGVLLSDKPAVKKKNRQKLVKAGLAKILSKLAFLTFDVALSGWFAAPIYVLSRSHILTREAASCCGSA
jgi:hypothetical protein